MDSTDPGDCPRRHRVGPMSSSAVLAASAGPHQGVGVLELSALLVLAHVQGHLHRLAHQPRLVAAELGQQTQTLGRADGSQRLGALVPHLPTAVARQPGSVASGQQQGTAVSGSQDTALHPAFETA